MYCMLSNQDARVISSYGLSSPDVEKQFGSAGSNSRFEFNITDVDPSWLSSVKLRFVLDNGGHIFAENLISPRISTDPYHALNRRFFEALHGRTYGTVLEIGSRARSAVDRRHLIPETWKYVGLDIQNGPSVDIVADAHDLSNLFPVETFDAVFSMSTFEHLLMPWKVVIEANRVMKTGALFFVTSHQTYPIHDAPWDFWRFSSESWDALFNRSTGFEIVDRAVGESASIVPHLTHEVVRDTYLHPAYLASACIARKIDNTKLRWDVKLRHVIRTSYPA